MSGVLCEELASITLLVIVEVYCLVVGAVFLDDAVSAVERQGDTVLRPLHDDGSPALFCSCRVVVISCFADNDGDRLLDEVVLVIHLGLAGDGGTLEASILYALYGLPGTSFSWGGGVTTHKRESCCHTRCR